LPKTPLEVTAQLNHRLMPVDRGARYEDPLHDALALAGLGEVLGGGTMQLESGEIEYIDVEVSLSDATRGIPFVIERLQALGAPKGSKLHIVEGDTVSEIPFGAAEGVAVYLDGVNLPDDVYATSDVNVVIEELDRRLGGVGAMQSYWQGPRETALYFYGRDAEEMKRHMAGFLATYRLCTGARVVTIAPRTA
jgi:hypothetical protein